MDYGRQIYQQLVQLNGTVDDIWSWLQQWGTSIIGFFETIVSWLPWALFFLCAVAGVNLVMRLFFPSWGVK